MMHSKLPGHLQESTHIRGTLALEDEGSAIASTSKAGAKLERSEQNTSRACSSESAQKPPEVSLAKAQQKAEKQTHS